MPFFTCSYLPKESLICMAAVPKKNSVAGRLARFERCGQRGDSRGHPVWLGRKWDPAVVWWEVFFWQRNWGMEGLKTSIFLFWMVIQIHDFFFSDPFFQKDGMSLVAVWTGFFNAPPKNLSCPYNFRWPSPPSFSHSCWPKASRSIRVSRRNRIWPRRRPWRDLPPAFPAGKNMTPNTRWKIIFSFWKGKIIFWI